jgi:hypothetical protein
MNTAAAHPVAPEEIMAFFDGELSAADAQAVAAHLDACSACASIADKFRGLSQSLAQWNVSSAPQKLEKAVNDFASKASAKSKSRKPSAPFRFSIWNWRLWAFGGTGVVAGALLLLGIEVSNSYRLGRVESQRPMAMMVSQNSDKETAGYAPPESLKGRMNNSLSAPYRMATRASGGGGAPIMNAGVGGIVADAVAPQAATAPMIARTASLSIIVKDLTAARASLDAILARHQGYSAQLTVESAANAHQRLTATLRIPVSGLSATLGDLKTLGRVNVEYQSSEDVSQQHADLAERLKTARVTEERFRGILQQRTGNISDVLEVEESIARVRGEIESMEAEQTGLEHRVDFATIDLSLSEEYKEEIASTSAAFSLRFHNAFVAGYRHATGTVAGIFLFLVEYGISILIWLAIIFSPAIFIWRRYRKARSTM